MTIREALRHATERLSRHRVSNSRLNAEVLLAHCLASERSYLFAHDQQELAQDDMQQFENCIYDRISGVPVQYIVGRQEFYGRYFKVSRSVLIPRPETEYAVEAILQLNPAPGTSIIDVGTGSGCIALTLALELPQAAVTATDISFEALQVARTNALELGARASIVCTDLLDAVSGPFDIIVSNPPYVSPSEASNLQIEVREHEPHVALFASNNGMDIFTRLVPAARDRLKPGGYFIAEMGFSMEERVLGLFGRHWELLPTRKDLQGIPRIVVARARGGESVHE